MNDSIAMLGVALRNSCPLLNFTSPLLGLFLSLFHSRCAFAQGSEKVQPHFSHIGSFPLGLRLAAHQHQQVTQEQGRNRKWAACGGDSSLEGLSGSAPRPGPCQSAKQGTYSSYYLRREGERGQCNVIRHSSLSLPMGEKEQNDLYALLLSYTVCPNTYVALCSSPTVQ